MLRQIGERTQSVVNLLRCGGKQNDFARFFSTISTAYAVEGPLHRRDSQPTNENAASVRGGVFKGAERKVSLLNECLPAAKPGKACKTSQQHQASGRQRNG